MSILNRSSSEYYITMRDDSDRESFEYVLDKLCDDEIIIDWDNTEFDEVLSEMSSAFERPIKGVHIFIDTDKDTEERWRRIGNALGMSLLDLAHAKKLETKIYRAHFKDIPEDSLWNKPLPGTKPIKDYHGSMITLGRMDQLKEDDENFFDIDWLDECLLFYLDAGNDITDLKQKIEDLLLQT